MLAVEFAAVFSFFLVIVCGRVVSYPQVGGRYWPDGRKHDSGSTHAGVAKKSVACDNTSAETILLLLVLWNNR